MIRLFLLMFLSLATLFADGIKLTKAEKQWLEKNPVIKVGIDPNFAPVEFIDEEGYFKGVTADYLKEMEKSLGIEFKIVKNRTWNEIISMVKTKSIDVLSCIVRTPQRSEYLDYTTTYLSVPMVIVTNKETGYINDIKELDGKAVAVIDGYTPNELLEENHKNIYLVKTKDLTQALELVSSGKTFAHVGNLSRVTYLLKEKGFQNLTISGITHYTYHFSMGIKKGDYLLRSIMQKAFDAIPKKVKNQIYNKWFPLSFREEPDYTLIWQILIVTLIITLIFSFWVIRLNMNIRRKKIAKEELLEDKAWLNNSLDTLDLSAWQWDLQTNQIRGNPKFAQILELGDQELTISAKYFKSLINEQDLPLLLNKLESHFSKKIDKFSIILRVNTNEEVEKQIEFTGKIVKFDIFNNPKKIVGTIKERED